MHSVQILLRVSKVVLLATLSACSSDTETEDPQPDNQMERATALCGRRCDKEIATRCTATPSDHKTTCVAACTKKYNDHPSCSSDLITLDSCRSVGGTYTCDASGMPLLGPVGLCKTELETCTSCTGETAEGCR